MSDRAIGKISENPNKSLHLSLSSQRMTELKRALESLPADEQYALTADTEWKPSSRKRGSRKRVRNFKKKDMVWAIYDTDLEPVLILHCSNNKIGPKKYRLLWLRWIDSSDDEGREGQCSQSVESEEILVKKISDAELDGMHDRLGDRAIWEIQRWRPDLYAKHWKEHDHQYINHDKVKWETKVLDFAA